MNPLHRRAARIAAVLTALLAVLFAAGPARAFVADTRWASGVVAASSEYSPIEWSAAQALGQPDTWPGSGDIASAWAPLGQDDQREFLELSFDSPAPINYVAVLETFNPGAVDSIYTWNPGTLSYDLQWAAVAHPTGGASRMLAVQFATTPYAVSRIRLALDSPAVPGWNEIDAVAIGVNAVTVSRPQWAYDALSSSDFGDGTFSAANVPGPPDAYPNYGDNVNVWASQTPDGGREWLQTFYSPATPISGVAVYETFNPGAIDSIYVRNSIDQSLHLVYAATPAVLPPVPRILRVTFPATPYAVDAVRITVASDVVPGWNEIDAVAVGVDTLVIPVVAASVPLQGLPQPGALEPARPDPFRGSTELAFTLDRDGPARLAVYDVRGARVRTLLEGSFGAGRRTLSWDGADDGGRRAPAGLYFVRIEAGGRVSARRVVRLP